MYKYYQLKKPIVKETKNHIFLASILLNNQYVQRILKNFHKKVNSLSIYKINKNRIINKQTKKKKNKNVENLWNSLNINSKIELLIPIFEYRYVISIAIFFHIFFFRIYFIFLFFTHWCTFTLVNNFVLFILVFIHQSYIHYVPKTISFRRIQYIL